MKKADEILVLWGAKSWGSQTAKKLRRCKFCGYEFDEEPGPLWMPELPRGGPVKLVDVKVYELAEYFAPDGTSREKVQELAEEIQGAIEDWFLGEGM